MENNIVSHLLRSSQREIKTKLRAADVKAAQTASKRKQNFRVDISLLITDNRHNLSPSFYSIMIMNRFCNEREGYDGLWYYFQFLSSDFFTCRSDSKNRKDLNHCRPTDNVLLSNFPVIPRFRFNNLLFTILMENKLPPSATQGNTQSDPNGRK